MSARRRLQKAEKGLETAQTACEDAEARLATLQSAIDTLEGQAGEAGAKIQEIHATGESADGLTELRQARRRLHQEVEDLDAERPVLHRILADRRKQERKSRVEVEIARRVIYREEAEALGDEIRGHLHEAADSWEKLLALEGADNQCRSKIVYELEHREGPGGPHPVHAAGLEPSKRLLTDLARAFV